MKEEKICETIRELRARRGITQEVLAQALDVSIQAVSKWETGNSLPDILLLPRIADFFEISLDALFFGPENSDPASVAEKPQKDRAFLSFQDDDILRIVQFIGTRLLKAEDWYEGKTIQLALNPELDCINLEVWGDAQIDGEIGGNLEAGGSVKCDTVGGNISAGNSVQCDAVGGNASAGNTVSCDSVGGNVSAGGNVRCDSVGGNIFAASVNLDA